MAVKQGQGDLATKQDIDHLRTELKSDNVWLKWALGVNLALTSGIFAAIISGTITLTLAP